MRTTKKQIAKYEGIMEDLGWSVYAKGEIVARHAVAVSNKGEKKFFGTNNELFEFICEKMFVC